MPWKNVRSSQSDRHHDKRAPDSGKQWSLRQALKLYSSSKRQTAADDDNSSLSSKRSAKSSNSGTSSSAGFPITKGHQTQHRVTRDAQCTSTRGQAEQRNNSAAAAAAVAALEPKVDGAGEKSASSGSSRMSISSSASQAEAPSATARATKRPGRSSAEVQFNTKKRSSAGSAEVAAERDDEPRQKSSSASQQSRSAAAAFDKTATGVEPRRITTPADKDLLAAATPMDRYERVKRYLERSDMLPLPTTKMDAEPQQSYYHRRQKHTSHVNGSDPSHRAIMAAVMAAMPAKLHRDSRAQSNSYNESDNGINDLKTNARGKQSRRLDGYRSAKKRRHRSDVKYCFQPFDEPSVEKQHKRPRRQRYESSSSSRSSSAKDSMSENATPPLQLSQSRRTRPEAAKQRHRSRRHAGNRSSSDGSWRSPQPRDERQQIATAVARACSLDSVMPTRNHKLPKTIEQNSSAASKFSPDAGHGRRSRNHGRSAAMLKTKEARLYENDNELLINEADKDQWRKYFADLYTFNMLQNVRKSAKKQKTKRRHDDVDANNDGDVGVQRQNTFYPAPPEAVPGGPKAIGFVGNGNPAAFGESYPTTNYDGSHRIPFGSGSLSNVVPPEASSTNRALAATSHHDTDVAAYNSWPGSVAKPSATPVVDEISGRQTLLPLPSEPVPLFSLNLSGVMSSVKEVLASRLCCEVCNWRAETQEAFTEHLLTHEHRVAEKSAKAAKPEALTAVANKIQTRPMATVLREYGDHKSSYYCRACRARTPGTALDHRRTEEHKKKAGTARRGCLLCMTGSFDAYDEYITHMDSEEHKQKKIQLDLEHKARKSRLPKTQLQAPASSQRRQRSENDEADAAEQITLDEMFVIDSAGDYSVSGDESVAPAGDDDDGRTSKRNPASWDAYRRREFQGFLSYLRSVDCKFQEAVPSMQLVKAEESRMDVDDEADQPRSNGETSSPIGTDCVIEVSGHFCCACRELWQDRQQALTIHCASKKHRQNYEKLRLATLPQENSEDKLLKSSRPADSELARDVVRVPQLSMLAELDDDDTGEGLIYEDSSDNTEEL